MYLMRTSWGYGVFKGNLLQAEFETETEAIEYIASQKAKEERQ